MHTKMHRKCTQEAEIGEFSRLFSLELQSRDMRQQRLQERLEQSKLLTAEKLAGTPGRDVKADENPLSAQGHEEKFDEIH